MGNSGYVTLTRQAGLLNEIQRIANNMSNISTTGYRKSGAIFSEYVFADHEGGSLSMANANVVRTDFRQGPLTQTGGSLDFAIEGDGFFLIQTPNGDQLTRAGSFSPNAFGDLVTPDGYPVLDIGGAPIFIPPDARNIAVASDGTLSADGRPLTQIGLFEAADPIHLTHTEGTRFDAGDVVPVEGGVILQGFLEESNVDPISEIARMIEVQRAYELGQKFLDQENDRIRNVLKTLT